jgi:argininosuccinate lyase
MAMAAEENFLSVTELADTLVRSTGISFHAAHAVVSHAVKELQGNYDADAMTDVILRELPSTTRGEPVITREEIRTSLSANNFVSVRRAQGGPASEALDPEILRAQEQLAADERWLFNAETLYKNAHSMMKQESAALLKQFYGL